MDFEEKIGFLFSSRHKDMKHKLKLFVNSLMRIVKSEFSRDGQRWFLLEGIPEPGLYSLSAGLCIKMLQNIPLLK